MNKTYATRVEITAGIPEADDLEVRGAVAVEIAVGFRGLSEGSHVGDDESLRVKVPFVLSLARCEGDADGVDLFSDDDE